MVQTWLSCIAFALVAAGLARILFLFGFRRPVLARTGSTDLTEGQRRFDGDMLWLRQNDGVVSPGDQPYKKVLARVGYDVDGISYRADVAVPTRKGERPDASLLLWYDPRDPRRVTAIGPAWAMLLILIGGGMLVLAHQLPS